ncbi:unnamed protein product [Lampetra planeri]
MAARLSSQPDVLHGVHSSSVQLSLLSSGKTIYESGDSVLWWTDASSGVSAADPSRCRLIRLSSSGRAVVSDLRSPGGVMSQAQLELQTHQCNLEHVRVSWAPALDDRISVSGPVICLIFSTAQADIHCIKEIHSSRFQWRGPRSTTPPGGRRSLWKLSRCLSIVDTWFHPSSAMADLSSLQHTSGILSGPQTLLSAASDGSVHVWDWIDVHNTSVESTHASLTR